MIRKKYVIIKNKLKTTRNKIQIRLQELKIKEELKLICKVVAPFILFIKTIIIIWEIISILD